MLKVLRSAGQPLIASRLGLYLQSGGLSNNQLLLIGLICLSGALIGLIPGFRVYRYSLADGMTVKL